MIGTTVTIRVRLPPARAVATRSQLNPTMTQTLASPAKPQARPTDTKAVRLKWSMLPPCSARVLRTCSQRSMPTGVRWCHKGQDAASGSGLMFRSGGGQGRRCFVGRVGAARILLFNTGDHGRWYPDLGAARRAGRGTAGERVKTCEGELAGAGPRASSGSPSGLASRPRPGCR